VWLYNEDAVDTLYTVRFREVLGLSSFKNFKNQTTVYGDIAYSPVGYFILSHPVCYGSDSSVYVHADDAEALQSGRQTATLNYVKPTHFHHQPYPGFSACRYRVPPTTCQLLTAGQVQLQVPIILLAGREYVSICKNRALCDNFLNFAWC